MLKEGFGEIKKFIKEKEGGFEMEMILEEVLDKLKEIRKKGENIGEGETAEVFVCKTNKDVCYKIMKKNNMKDRVDADQEGSFLDDTYDLENSVESPKPYYSIKTASGIEVLVMERLHSVSIEAVVNGKDELPEEFDFNSYFKSLFSFFEKMHETKKIFHRDPHEGNLMINKKTGKPGVIDYGSAVRTYLSTDNPYKKTDAKGGVHFTTSDEDMIKRARTELRQHILEKMKKN